jgi:hypothetical protein
MKSYTCIILALAAAANASVLSTTNIATVLATVSAPSALTIPANAMAAIAKLGTGGANAASLTAAETAAIAACAKAAVANNTASKANLADGTGSAGAIAFVTNKVSTHACESADQQISLATGGAGGSDTDINLLISNIGVLNVNTAKAGITSKRAEIFLS